MPKVTFEERDFSDYTASDLFIHWERSLDCFYEIVKLIQSTGTTEQLTEMLNIFAKYNINMEGLL